MLDGGDLRKVYATGRGPIEAVAGVSLRLEAGQFLAVCGRSGSGKSTLLAMLGGLCRPSAGTVLVAGTDLWALPARRLAEFRGRQVGFVFQFAGLLPTLRAVDNVALPALVAGATDLTATYTRAARLLAEVGLADRLGAYPGDLSGGEQRRVALARALVNDPPLVLADEPTADLDEETEAEILRVLLAHGRGRGKALVIITHSPAVAKRADRVLHLCQGRVADVEVPSAAAVTELASPVKLVEPAPAAPAPEPLGAGFGRFLAGFAAWAAGVGLAVGGLNYGTALYQRRQVQQQKTARQELHEAALFQLRATPEDIAFGPDGSYRLTLALQNVEPEKDLFVLAPAVRGYVQVGRGWDEVPLRSADAQEGRVMRLAGKHTFAYEFTPGGKAFEELLPGYMHVRFACNTIVSRRAEPGGDLTERADDFYVYLKPHGADDAAILRKTKFPGKPPTWIIMPPH
jgi:putative ABC transport system ATP-binding protein/macrolide transport system ATP-binding/permease protein/lipoprotein-releasing system ATP-binding protein